VEPATTGRAPVPRPVATFTARDTDLGTLTRALTGPVAGPVTLHGIPGVGKTQLTRVWAHQHADSYGIAWQARAADPLTAVADLAQLADRLDLAPNTDQETAAAAVVEALSGRQGWLLVFDDASPDAVRLLLPHRGGHVVLTSRSPNSAPVAATQKVGLFAPQPAAAFLDPHHVLPTDAAVRLAERLGYLPLALEQARAYCAATGRSLDGYLADYRQTAAAATRQLQCGHHSTCRYALRRCALDRVRRSARERHQLARQRRSLHQSQFL